MFCVKKRKVDVRVEGSGEEGDVSTDIIPSFHLYPDPWTDVGDTMHSS